jgi:hypothetical protein
VSFISLRNFVQLNGQAGTARMLGCTQGYISQALSAHRAVYINQIADGKLEAIELKPFAVPYPARDRDCMNRLHAIGSEKIGVAE